MTTATATKRLTMQAFAVKTARRRFVNSVKSLEMTPALKRHADSLVKQTTTAKHAVFLDKYRAQKAA